MTGCRESTYAQLPNGYCRVAWRIDGKQRWDYAHRIAWFGHNGAIPDQLQVRHRCDNRPCCNFEHLLLGTPANNSADMVSRSRQRSSWQPRKLTPELVLEMRRLRTEGWTRPALAAQFGVAVRTVEDVIGRRRWKRLDDPS